MNAPVFSNDIVQAATKIQDNTQASKDKCAISAQNNDLSLQGSRCVHCDILFSNSTNRYRHQKTCKVAKGAVSYKCEHCSGIFALKGNFDRHNCKKSDNRTCLICRKLFSHHDTLKNHRCSASSNEPTEKFLCRLCNAEYPYKKNLQRHMKLKHSGQEVLEPVQPDLANSIGNGGNVVGSVDGMQDEEMKVIEEEEEKVPQSEAIFHIAGHQELSAIINQEEIENGGSFRTRKPKLSTDRSMIESINTCSPPFVAPQIAEFQHNSVLGHNSALMNRLETTELVSLDPRYEYKWTANPTFPSDKENVPLFSTDPSIVPLPIAGKQSCLKLPSATQREFTQLPFPTTDGKATGKKTLPSKRRAARIDGAAVDDLEKEMNQSQAAQSFSSAFLKTAADTNHGQLTSTLGASSASVLQSSVGLGSYGTQARNSGPQLKRARIRDVSNFFVPGEERQEEDQEKVNFNKVSSLPAFDVPSDLKQSVSLDQILKGIDKSDFLELPQENFDDYEGQTVLKLAHNGFDKLMQATTSLQQPLKYNRQKLNNMWYSSHFNKFVSDINLNHDFFTLSRKRIVSTLENSLRGGLTKLPQGGTYRQQLMKFPRRKREKIYACTKAGEMPYINSAAPDELLTKDSRIFRQPPLKRVFFRLSDEQRNDISEISQNQLKFHLSSIYYQCRHVLKCTLAQIQKEIDDIISDLKSFIAIVSLGKLHSEEHRCFGKTFLARTREGAAAVRHCNRLCYLTDEAFGQLSHLEKYYKEVEALIENSLRDSQKAAQIKLKAPNYKMYLGQPAQMQIRVDKCAAQYAGYVKRTEQLATIDEEAKEMISQVHRQPYPLSCPIPAPPPLPSCFPQLSRQLYPLSVPWPQSPNPHLSKQPRLHSRPPPLPCLHSPLPLPSVARIAIELPRTKMTRIEHLNESTDEEEAGTDDEELQQMFGSHGVDIKMKRYRKRLETIVRVLRRKQRLVRATITKVSAKPTIAQKLKLRKIRAKFTKKQELKLRWASGILDSIRARWNARLAQREEMRTVNITRAAEYFQDFKEMLSLTKEEQKIQATLEKKEKSLMAPENVTLKRKVLKIDYEWARDIICKNRALLNLLGMIKNQHKFLYKQSNMKRFKDSQLMIDVLLSNWRDNLKVARRTALQHFVMLNIDTSTRDPWQRQYFKVNLRPYFFDDIAEKYKLTERDFQVTLRVSQEWDYKNVTSMNSYYHSYNDLNYQINRSVRLLFKMFNLLQMLCTTCSFNNEFDRLECAQCIMKQLANELLSLNQDIAGRSTLISLNRQLTSDYQRAIRVNAHQARQKELQAAMGDEAAESNNEAAIVGNLLKSAYLPNTPQLLDAFSQCKAQQSVLEQHIDHLIMLNDKNTYEVDIFYRSIFSINPNDENTDSAALAIKVKAWELFNMQLLLKKRKVFILKEISQDVSSLAPEDPDLTQVDPPSSPAVVEIINPLPEEDTAMQDSFYQFSQLARNSQLPNLGDNAYNDTSSSSDSDDASRHGKGNNGDLTQVESAEETKRNSMEEIEPANLATTSKDVDMEKQNVLNVEESKKVSPGEVAQKFSDPWATPFGKSMTMFKSKGYHALKPSSLLQGNSQIPAVGNSTISKCQQPIAVSFIKSKLVPAIQNKPGSLLYRGAQVPAVGNLTVSKCQFPMAIPFIKSKPDPAIQNVSIFDRVLTMENEYNQQVEVPYQHPQPFFPPSSRPFGLPNLNDSCPMQVLKYLYVWSFRNVVLQCLFTLAQVRQLISKTAIATPDLASIPLTSVLEEVRCTGQSGTQTDLTQQLQSIFTMVESTQASSTLVEEKQMNAYEFYRALLFKLNTEICSASEFSQSSTTSELFTTKLQAITTCATCSHSVTKVNPIIDMCLQMPPNDSVSLWTIHTAIRSLLASRQASINSHCAQCSAVGQCDRQLRIATPPEILVMQLKKNRSSKRDGTPDSSHSQHAQNGINVPMLLDLSSYMTQDNFNTGHLLSNDTLKAAKYELCAVIHQRNAKDIGCRYYCDVLRKGDDKRELWYVCSNTTIGQHSDKHNYIGCKTARILFYRRKTA